jgi:hypothetical protein
VHDEPGNAAGARVRHGAFEHRATKAARTVRRKDREPHFGEIVHEGHMGDTREHALIVVSAEDRVAPEVDSVDVGRDAAWRKRRAEPQGQVLAGQREKVRHERGTHAVIQLCDVHDLPVPQTRARMSCNGSRDACDKSIRVRPRSRKAWSPRRRRLSSFSLA